MEETFYSDKSYYRLKYENGSLEWRNFTEENDTKILDIESGVLAVVAKISTERAPQRYYLGFVVHYLDEVDFRYKYKQKFFAKSDSDIVQTWFCTLDDFVKAIDRRPKSILLFLNPNAGSRKALSIYTKKAKPLFTLADVKIILITTEKRHFIQEYLSKNGWPTEIGGIAAFGGDGTLCEVINGIVNWTAEQNGANIDSPDVDLRRPDVRVGIIPAGSTDTVSYSLHRTSDVETAVFHIILGNSLSMDIGVVHNESKFLSCYSSVLSYGFLAEVIDSSEGLRCLGPARYEISGFWNVIKNRKFNGKFIFATDDTNNANDKNRGTRVIIDSDSTVPSSQYFMVSVANISCSSSKSPNGLAPLSRRNDGLFNVIVVQELSLLQKIRFFRALASRTEIINNLPFVRVYKTNKIIFEANTSTRSRNTNNENDKAAWNCDGELIRTNFISAKCHSNFLQVFGLDRQV